MHSAAFALLLRCLALRAPCFCITFTLLLRSFCIAFALLLLCVGYATGRVHLAVALLLRHAFLRSFSFPHSISLNLFITHCLIISLLTPSLSPSLSLGTAGCSTYNLKPSCLCYQQTDKTNPPTESTSYYLFYYPSEETVQYLYETYPSQISPIDGVTDEHFIVWMRTAALTTFRKLYGRIYTADGGSFKAGDEVTVDIIANFEVDSFSGTKTLLISDLGKLGGRNVYIGQVSECCGVVL
jgi:hypothetical protein